MSHLEKEREFTIRDWDKEIIRLTKDEMLFLIDITVEWDYISLAEKGEKVEDSVKLELLDALESIYIHSTHADKRIARLCEIAKNLYIKLLDISYKDVLFVIKEIINIKGFITKFGVLDYFWQENEVTQIKNELIETVSRTRHLKLLKLSI
ncbi:hypothetical protein HBE96_00325 [Clostridium sp. P21]|uniref:Uncharacterized protein n=1 Tax=Clostridium muellerianum TaxID=2716538 RepID=A0A7Y0HM11_9CLOT|nr:hypothetical protein [Clostridium muellerianum]NMM61172.1 hypothetical protein [Clostridium muellerianum]